MFVSLADIWRIGKKIERGSKFSAEQIGCGETVGSPPIICRDRLIIRLTRLNCEKPPQS